MLNATSGGATSRHRAGKQPRGPHQVLHHTFSTAEAPAVARRSAGTPAAVARLAANTATPATMVSAVLINAWGPAPGERGSDENAFVHVVPPRLVRLYNRAGAQAWAAGFGQFHARSSGGARRAKARIQI